MKTEHFFLASPSAAVPERWADAFPLGRGLNAAELMDWVRGHDISHSLVWLSAVDVKWSEYLRQVMRLQPSARVLVLSNAPNPREGLVALNDGARGYTHSYAVPALLQEVALVVEHGGLWVGPDLMQRLVSSTSAALAGRAAVAAARGTSPSNPAVDAGLGALSAREAEVARAVASGRSNREVAELMHISERTVKAHLGVVFEKLGVRDRLQLVLRMSSVLTAATGATGATGAISSPTGGATS